MEELLNVLTLEDVVYYCESRHKAAIINNGRLEGFEEECE